jgi:hypothetical protein
MAKRRGFSATSGEPPKSSVTAIAGVHTFSLENPAFVPRWTSGRESWVFCAERPDQLCGYHPQLIGSALAPDEPLQYLLYSPIFDAKDGPFHVGGAPGSHAIGITPNRLLVSRDPHAEAPPRSVLSVDLAAVSCLEIGCALALGWFVIRFSGTRDACPVVFAGLGMRHFRAIVRTYRILGHEERLCDKASLDWPSVWEGVPAYLRTEVEPLTEETEQPFAVLRSPERWTTEKRLWRSRPVCASAPGLLVASSRGLLWAASEPRPTPSGISFGVNVTVVRPDRMLGAAIGTRGAFGVLRLHAGAGPEPHELEVPFDGEDIAAAEEIVQMARAWRDRG